MPSDDEFKVTLDALSKEAEKWRQLANVMATAHLKASNQVLPPPAFFAGHDLATPALLSPKYDELQALIVGFCEQARTEFVELAGAMERARKRYEASDGAAERNTKAIYGS